MPVFQLVSRAVSCIHVTVVYMNFCLWNHRPT